MIKVNGDPLPHTPGMTVRQVLQERNFKFPLLVIRIDGVFVPRDAYDTTEVPDGADVQVIHLMSGG
jgi:sulfur carrier protein